MIRQKSDIPVLFLVTRDGVADRIRSLELGVDGYLVKPFTFAGLLTRIRRCLRQSSGHESEYLSVGDLDIDVLSRKVVRANIEVGLTGQEFALLHLLTRRSGKALSRTSIALYVWDVNFDADTNVMNVAIRRLRAKLNEPFDVKLIHAVRDMSYVLDPHRGK